MNSTIRDARPIILRTSLAVFAVTLGLGGPASAGVAASTYGTEVVNDFGDARYDGPCPPTNLPPNVHHYVFTVYALRAELSVPSSANFPANVEALFHALLDAAMRGEVLGSRSE